MKSLGECTNKYFLLLFRLFWGNFFYLRVIVSIVNHRIHFTHGGAIFGQKVSMFSWRGCVGLTNFWPFAHKFGLELWNDNIRTFVKIQIIKSTVKKIKNSQSIFYVIFKFCVRIYSTKLMSCLILRRGLRPSISWNEQGAVDPRGSGAH